MRFCQLRCEQDLSMFIVHPTDLRFATAVDCISSGNEVEYQDLAFSGRPIWLEWNDTIASTPAEKLPHGLIPETKVFVPNGFLRLSNGTKLSEYDQTCLAELEKAGLRHHQHVIVGDLRRLDIPCA